MTLREPNSTEPDIPEYKTIGIEGPTNTREYRVAVYFKYFLVKNCYKKFRDKRLADGCGNSVQMAQMQAAENALIQKAELFPKFKLKGSYLWSRMNENNNETFKNSSKKV